MCPSFENRRAGIAALSRVLEGFAGARLFCCLLPFLAGCWPYLPGAYEDYVDTAYVEDSDSPDTSNPDTSNPDTSNPDTSNPDTSSPTDGPVLLGVASGGDLVGAYWASRYEDHTIIFGFAPAGTPYSLVESLGLVRGQCVGSNGFIDAQIVDGAIDVGGPSTIGVTAGTQSTNALRNTSFDVWISSREATSFPTNSAYSLSTTLDVGTVSGEFLRTPSDFTITAPNMNTTFPPVVARSDLTVSWSGTLSDDVYVTITLLDDNLNPVLVRRCLASGSSFNVPLSGFPGIGTAAGATIAVTRVRASAGALSGTAAATYRSHAIRTKQGAVYF